MFGSFKKWIQTTVDTTTNSVLSFNPLTALDETFNNTTQVNNNGNNYNSNHQYNEFKRPIHQQQNIDFNSSNERIKLSKNHNQELNENKISISSNSNDNSRQFRSFNQTPPSLSIQNKRPEYSSKTQPSTPILEPSFNNFSNSFTIPKSASIQNEHQPDLSHLSKEEQAHIALVLQRAQVDEIESTQEL
jgi:hypothetical protein